MNQAGNMSAEQLQQFSEKFREHTANILNRLQVQSRSPYQLDYVQSMNGFPLEGTSLDGAKLMGSLSQEHLEDQLVFQNDDLWLPYLPVPPHMLSPTAQAEQDMPSHPSHTDPYAATVSTSQESQWPDPPYSFVDSGNTLWGYSNYAAALMATPTRSMHHSRQGNITQIPV